jgi:hypothetical protein
MTTSIPILNLTPKVMKEKQKSMNSSPHLFKPLPIKIRKNENNIKFPLSNATNESNVPLIYPNQFQYGSFSNLSFNSSTQLRNFAFQEKNVNKKTSEIKSKPCCSCVKTKCIKKYCECFANNKFCINCCCADCRNKEIYMTYQNKNNQTNSNVKEIIFCTCSKSGCNKKYCECYKEGLKCNIKCRCIKCLNCEDQIDKNNDNEKNICLDETRCDSGKKSISEEINEFNIQKISVQIGKSQTFINTEKLSKEDFVLLCKKRKSF